MSVKKYLGETSLALLWAKIKAIVPSTYAGSSSAGGSATRANAISMGQVDSTSTSTVFTATIDGVTELYDGLCIYLRNGVVTSASGWTLNINGLGAKPVYQTQADASRVTTIFNVAYTGLFIYNSTRVEGGCWDYFYGYNSDTNTIAYMVRTGQSNLSMHSALYRYQICFTMMNGEILPANGVSNSTGTSKTLTTESFDPFGQIYYYNTTTAITAGNSPSASYMWTLRHDVDLRYSFNCGKTLVAESPVYVQCSPQSDGTVKLSGNSCITQTLPSTEDGYVYIHLGRAYSTYQIVLDLNHPVFYYYKGTIRLWTNQYMPTTTSELTNDSGFITSASLPTKTSDLTNDSGFITSASVPTKTSDLTNDSGFITDAGVTSFNGSTGAITYTAPVTSVNGSTGAVSLTASDVGALPSSTAIPTKTSDLTNDSGFLTSYTETDPTVPAWAKASTKPTYTAAEVGALPSTTAIPSKTSDLTNDSDYQTSTQVNSSIATAIGSINSFNVLIVQNLPTQDIDTHTIYFISNGGSGSNLYDEYMYINNTWEKIGTTDIDLSGYMQTTHVANSITQSDITNWNNKLSSYTETDPTVPAWAKASTKPTYTASEVGALPDTTAIPTKTSDLTNDSGFITSYTETDPTVPSWAKAATKPTYTASEVGAATDDHVHGDITNSGDITTTATIASGDRLVINDESASKVTNSSITFGTSATTFLANNGTWKTPTDTKVTATALNGENSTRGLLFASNNGSTTTDTVATSNKLMYNDSAVQLSIYNTDRTKYGFLKYNMLDLADANSSYDGYISTNTLSATRSYKLPDQDGTVALTSDIPTVPTKTSDLTNDSGFITSASVPTKTSDLTNDSGFLTSYTETDPTVPSWAKESTKPTYTASEVGAVAKTGDTMTGNLTLDSSAYLVFKHPENQALSVPERNIRINSSGFVGSGDTAISKLAFSVAPGNQTQRVRLDNIDTPTDTSSSYQYLAANKGYVDGLWTSTKITNTLGYTPYNGTTNPNGYLTLATLPVYDGSYSAITS